MSNKTVGFVGGGRITRIFLEGWQRANARPASIVVSDPNAESLAKLKARFPGVETAADNRAAAAQDIVFLAVHPPVMAEVCAGIRGAPKAGTIMVSLAPKFTLAKLTELLGGFARLARMIPNAPSIIGAGYNPLSFAPGLPAADRSALLALLAPLGKSPEVPEASLEPFAVLTGRGPTYFWFQFHELLRFAEAAGLDAEQAREGLETTVAGALRTLTSAGLSPQEVLDLIPVKAPPELEIPATEVFRNQLPATLQQIRP